MPPDAEIIDNEVAVIVNTTYSAMMKHILPTPKFNEAHDSHDEFIIKSAKIILDCCEFNILHKNRDIYYPTYINEMTTTTVMKMLYQLKDRISNLYLSSSDDQSPLIYFILDNHLFRIKRRSIRPWGALGYHLIDGFFHSYDYDIPEIMVKQYQEFIARNMTGNILY